MQNLRDQLLKAGLITEEQRAKAEARPEHDRGRRAKGQAQQADRDRDRAPEGGTDGRNPREEVSIPSMPKLSKKALMKQPVNRMIDLSDPGVLKIFQAIEAHRVAGSVKGDMPFHFSLRDGRVRKIFVTKEIEEALGSGRLAIVENGEPEKHVIVASDAVPIIREVDPEAVRFCN